MQKLVHLFIEYCQCIYEICIHISIKFVEVKFVGMYFRNVFYIIKSVIFGTTFAIRFCRNGSKVRIGESIATYEYKYFNASASDPITKLLQASQWTQPFFFYFHSARGNVLRHVQVPRVSRKTNMCVAVSVRLELTSRTKLQLRGNKHRSLPDYRIFSTSL